MTVFLENFLPYWYLCFQILPSLQILFPESQGPKDAILSHMSAKHHFKYTTKIFVLNESNLVLQTNMMNLCG